VASLRVQYWDWCCLFNIFVANIDNGIECTLCNFPKNTKLCCVVDMLEGRDAIQRDLDRLESWACLNFMRSNKAECKVHHMGQGNPKPRYRLGGEWIDSNPDKKDLGVLVDEKLSMTQPCVLTAQKADCILDCIQSSVASRSREGILPLCSALLQPQPGVLCPALEPSAQDRRGPVGAGPEEATKMIRGIKNLSCEARLRELGLFSLEKRSQWGDLRAAFWYLKGAYKQAGEGLFQEHVVIGQGLMALN